MPRRPVAKATGVWEKVPGSGVWWIRYRAEGKLKREKVGRRSDAIDLYRIRKSDVRAGIKLPPNMRTRGVTFGKIAEEAEEWYAGHGKKDLRNVKGRMKFLVKEFGDQPADKIKPSQIDAWISSHKDWTPATGNRYKALMSKTFKLALASGKVSGNPARLVERRAESPGRIRYLLDEEEVRLRKVITERFAMYLPAFVVAIRTGMRLSEQFTLEWPEVSFGRNRIFLDKTKNGSDREIPMSKTCREAFLALHQQRTKEGRIFQSMRGEPLNTPRKWFETAIEEAKIPNFTWHDLRHTFCSRLIMAGVDLKTAQTLMGHKTISMTARYAHLSSAHLDTAVDKLDAKIKAAPRARGLRRAA
jgi:integrase